MRIQKAINELVDYVAENDKLTISFETVTMAIAALEKQISKKATDIRYFGRFGRVGYYIGLCPCCKSGNNSEYQYCGVCGQAIDWSG